VGNYATCESLAQAAQQIQGGDLTLAYVFPQAEGADPNAQVSEQFPAAGSQVPPGTSIFLYVKGPADTCP
jgi:beta-lactam-binding protein with PASTA domain